MQLSFVALLMCSISKATVEGSLTKVNRTSIMCQAPVGHSPSDPLFSGHQLFTSYVSCKLRVSAFIYLAALTGAHSVVITRWLVLAHKARLVDTRRRRGGRRAGHHLLWAGALSLHRCRNRNNYKGFLLYQSISFTWVLKVFETGMKANTTTD